MLARVHCGSLIGIDAYPVEVEVDVYPGLRSIAVVGLPDNAVKESTARVQSAIVNSGYPFLTRRITVNLALNVLMFILNQYITEKEHRCKLGK